MFKELLSHALAAVLIVGSVVACAPKDAPQGTAQSEGAVLKNYRLVCHIDGAVSYQADAPEIEFHKESGVVGFYPEQTFYYPVEGETCRILQAQ